MVADGLKFAALVAILSGLMIHATQGLGYQWQWYRVPAYIASTTPAGIVFGPLLRGLGVTLQIAAASLVLAFLIGLTTALMRLSGSVLGRLTARTYLELVRNTPLLVQIFFIYFVLSPVLQLSAENRDAWTPNAQTDFHRPAPSGRRWSQTALNLRPSRRSSAG